MPFLNRRRMIGATLGLGAGVLAGRSAWARSPGPALGPARPFSFDRLKDAAAASARRPWRPAPALDLPATEFDALAAVAYRPEMTLWADRGDEAIRLFPESRYARRPVDIYAVEDGQARQVRYAGSLFHAPDPGLARRLAAARGFAGFRAMNRDGRGDWLAFLGASYFRSADPFNQYGLSARGLAINTATGARESFPDFTAFWLERDAGQGLTVYAALEGEHVAGAYRIANRRGPGGLVQDIECVLHFRQPVERLGVAPLTSMFWYGENGQPADRDWRPEIHDSDGLALLTGSGERIWRPLVDPPRVVTDTFADVHPGGFGLSQRDRSFDHYQDDGVFYERRPSAWVEPVGDWGAGAVALVEIPTDGETNDNIVAFWTPQRPVRAGDSLAYRYRLSWTAEDPATPGLAKVTATRIGEGPSRRPDQRRIVVDFQGGPLAGLGRDAGVQPRLSVARGHIDGAGCYPVAGADRWRLMIDVTVQDPDSADLRGWLGRGGARLTETWSYQLFNR